MTSLCLHRTRPVGSPLRSECQLSRDPTRPCRRRKVSASAPRCGLADLPPGYHHELKAGFHNYHFTAAHFQLPPFPAPHAETVVLEGFAPNLNKHLHVGHLKNLALANA